MVFVANNCWGKKEMIQILRDHGIIFRVCKNDSFILRMFMEHLAEFQVTKYIKCDPRAGWVQCNSECELTLYPELIESPIQSKKEYKWKFQTADSWLFPPARKNPRFWKSRRQMPVKTYFHPCKKHFQATENPAEPPDNHLQAFPQAHSTSSSSHTVLHD